MAIYIPAGLLAFCRGLLLPTLPLFADSFGVSLSLIGIVLAGEALGMLIADAPAGYLVRRMEPKLAMMVGVAIMGAAAVGSALAPTIWALLITRVILGAGESLWNISRHAYLTHATLNQRRGGVMGLFAGVSRFGVFVGPAVGGAVAGAWGLRAPFALYALVVLITLLLLLLLVPREERPGGAPSSRRRREARAALRSSAPVLLNAGAGQLMLQLLRAGRDALVPLYGASVLGLAAPAVGLIVSAASLIDFTLFYPAGVILDRYGRKAAVIPSFILQGAAMALLPVTTGFSSLLLIAAVGGLGNGISTGSMMTLGADLAPRPAIAEFLALWRLIGDAGFVSGPLLVGFVAGAAGLPAASITIGALGGLSALWFAHRVPETLTRPK